MLLRTVPSFGMGRPGAVGGSPSLPIGTNPPRSQNSASTSTRSLGLMVTSVPLKLNMSGPSTRSSITNIHPSKHAGTKI